MATSPSLESAIDRLFQLPLEEFVAARNALAKEAAGADAARVRALQKPNLIAWALNQMYWSARPSFDALVTAAARLRVAQAAALMGKPSDLRVADAEHRAALRAALKEATAILAGAGHAATPDTVRLLTAAFEALPWKDPAGRLVRPPSSSGFEALAGLPVAEPSATARQGETAPPPPRERRPARGAGKRQAEAESTKREDTAEREAAAERERLARLKNAREEAASTRQSAAAAGERLRASEEGARGAREAERVAREQLDEARRKLREAEADYREAARAEAAARREAQAADERLARLERQ